MGMVSYTHKYSALIKFMSKDDKILLVIQKCENNYVAIKLSYLRASKNEKYCCRNSWENDNYMGSKTGKNLHSNIQNPYKN